MSAGTSAGQRSAVVTGGGGAIGSAVAARLARDGARVVVADLDERAARETVERLVRDGGAATCAACDVGEPDGAASAIEAALERFGRVDVVVNNAGITEPPATVDALDVEIFDEVVRVNLRGAFLVLGAAIRAMRAQGTEGAIINMGSSMAGWDVLSGSAAYVATKHAVVGLTRAAALDAARYGIRVNAVCPGVIATPLGVPDLPADATDSPAMRRFAERIPLRRIGRPEDVAAVVSFLASAESRHVTGAAWLVDGGQTLQSWSNAPDGAFPLFVHPDQQG